MRTCIVSFVVSSFFCTQASAQMTTRESVDSSGVQGNAHSGIDGHVISPDGRYVAFASDATNLVAGDTNGVSDVFVRDRQSGTTERVSIDSAGVQGNGNSYSPSISADGRYVAFVSHANNLVPGDTNSWFDVFVRDRQSGTTERVSVDSAGMQGIGGGSGSPSISADGRYVAFWSNATNLVAGDTNGFTDVFIHDRQTGSTERVNVDSTGAQANSSSDYFGSMSSDGRFVPFVSIASNLVAGDTNGFGDAFVRDRLTGTTERVSVNSGGVQGNDQTFTAWISGDGRYVAIGSQATNLVAGDANGKVDAFVHDRLLGTTELVSVDSAGTQGNDDSGSPAISADGHSVVFVSFATNLVAGDTNGFVDVFVHERSLTGFTSLCFPGSDGVRACPCSNPPNSYGVGCNNFGPNPPGGTGGAQLNATGMATATTATSLVFHATGMQTPCTLVVLFCGTHRLSGGVASGAGVRCVNQTITPRPYKTISGFNSGSVDFPSADVLPQGSGSDPWTRSGSPAPGTTLYYYANYRNPAAGSVPPCTSVTAFNETNAGAVTWTP